MSKWRGSLVLGLGFFLIWVAAELSGIVQLAVIPNDNGWGRWVPVVVTGVSGVALATWGNEIIRQQRKIARQQKKQRPLDLPPDNPPPSLSRSTDLQADQTGLKKGAS